MKVKAPEGLVMDAAYWCRHFASAFPGLFESSLPRCARCPVSVSSVFCPPHVGVGPARSASPPSCQSHWGFSFRSVVALCFPCVAAGCLVVLDDVVVVPL